MEKKENQASHQDRGNLIMPDTNVLIPDPMALRQLLNGNNTVVLAQMTILELDGLKNRPDIGHDVRMVIREIFTLRKEGKSVIIERRSNFSELGLKEETPDHQIIATFNYLLNNPNYSGYKKFKLITNDLAMKILAEDIFSNNENVSVETYQHNRIKNPVTTNFDKSYRIDYSLIEPINSMTKGFRIPFNKERFGNMKENSGILLEVKTDPFTKKNGKVKILAYKKGDWLHLIPPDIEIYGLTPLKSLEGEINWPQFLAIAQLKDEDINCVFMNGSSGSGKTIFAVATAFEQKEKYENIIITRPQVPFNNKETNGFLAGRLDDKLGPWLLPILQNIKALERISFTLPSKILKSDQPELVRDQSRLRKKNNRLKKNNQQSRESKESPVEDNNLFKKHGIDVFSLEYVRGTTWTKTLFIVDESQNSTPQEIKALITRMGEGSKIIFTGDLGQIDLSYLSAETSGLAHAMNGLTGYTKENGLVASVTFTYSVRSKLAALAEKFL